MLHKESVLKVEIIWALKILVNSYSFCSSAGKGELFSSMFPDSRITKQFPMGKTKEIYLIFQRLAPYFKDRLLNILNAARFIVTFFEESFNIFISKGEIDVVVRF